MEKNDNVLERIEYGDKYMNAILYDIVKKLMSSNKDKNDNRFTLSEVIDACPQMQYMVGGCIVDTLQKTKMVKNAKMPYLWLEFTKRGWKLLRKDDFDTEPPYDEWSEIINRSINELDSKKKKKVHKYQSQPSQLHDGTDTLYALVKSDCFSENIEAIFKYKEDADKFRQQSWRYSGEEWKIIEVPFYESYPLFDLFD